jgi:hypothetical protein
MTTDFGRIEEEVDATAERIVRRIKIIGNII